PAWAVGPDNVVLDWNAMMMAAIRQDNSSPTLSTRNLAILHLAIYDSVNSIVGTHQPYNFLETPPAGAAPEAAASGAGYTVLKSLYPSLLPRINERFNSWRATAPQDAGTTESIAFGSKIAEKLLTSRNGDGAAYSITYIPSNQPGQWRRTPPFFRPPV